MSDNPFDATRVGYPLWVVAEGEVTRLRDTSPPPRDRYGYDWLVVTAITPAQALIEAEAYDASLGVYPLGMSLFAACYREGLMDLPEDIAP